MNELWKGYDGSGEPYGLINLELSRLCGRLGETQYPDPNVKIYNPCAEQSLEDKETCCLGEIYLPNISHYEELLQVLQLQICLFTNEKGYRRQILSRSNNNSGEYNN
jgi:ribonucleotide reductase alpha subunit